MPLALKLCVAATACLIATSASTEPMAPEIATQIAAMGRVVAAPQTNALYVPLLEKEPYQGIKVTRDAKYGPAERNVLDVFTTETPGSGKPVFIHVHGGGFVQGNKKTPGSPLLDNIPLWAARNGMVGVNINYRLVPEAAFPSGPEDIANVIKWLRANIASHGGDPNRIYLLGWSAGGGHVASYVAHPEHHAAPNGGLAGAILMSAMPIDLAAPNVASAGTKAYFGDPATWEKRSSLAGLLKTTIPLMVVYAGFDPPEIEYQSMRLIDMRCRTEAGCPRNLLLKTHSHMSEGNAIGSKDTELTDQILEFVKTGK